MRFILIAAGLLLAALPCPAEDEKAFTKVTGTFAIPKDVASFKDRTVEIRLYAFDPRIADRPADLVEKVEVKVLAHNEGTETKKDFTVGAKGVLDPARRYYVTMFVLDGEKRTHIGEAAHAKGFAKVLTDGNPKAVEFTVRPVK